LLGSRYLPSVQTALISALDAPLAPIWVWLLFSKTPSGQTLIGGGVVLSAILGYIVYDTRANSAEG
jgi:drug/metabolite transporter (DMT)-like permease